MKELTYCEIVSSTMLLYTHVLLAHISKPHSLPPSRALRRLSIRFTMLHKQLFHQIDLDLVPSNVTALQHVIAATRKKGEVIEQNSRPFILASDANEMAAVSEEMTGKCRRLSAGQAMDRKDGEVCIERYEQRVQVLVNFTRRGHAAKLNGRIIQIDKVALGVHYLTSVEFIEFGSGQLMVQYSGESVFVDVWEQRGKICGWVAGENDGRCAV